MAAFNPPPQPDRLESLDELVGDASIWTLRILGWADIETPVVKAGSRDLVSQKALRLFVPPEDHPRGRTYVDLIGQHLVASLRPLLDTIVAGRGVLTLRRPRSRFTASFDVRYPTA